MRVIKIFIYSAILCMLFLSNIFANDIIPEKVKIGLYYLDKSVSSVELNSNSGFNIGYSDNDIYLKLFSESSNDIILKKDNNFHIQIEENLENYDSAKLILNQISGKYNSYIGYDGGWKVYIGPYDSSTLANVDFKKLESEFSTYTYKTINSSSKAIQLIVNNKIKFIYNLDKPLKILTNNNDIISVNGKKYRGSIIAIRQSTSDMTVINEVSFNEYLYSVVPSEMPPSWHIEALKTQAVAARTYAVNSLLTSPRVKNIYRPLGFDMTGTTEFQVYNGYANERESTKRAVDETNNQVIYYNNTPISAMFFSCSGGFTENSENVWVSEVPYLKAVEDKYMLSEDVAYKSWEITLNPAELKKQYATQGIDIGDIKDIDIIKYTPSGNALEMKVTGTKGEKIYKKLDIRGFILDKYLPNLSFKIQKSGTLTVSIINSKMKVSNQLLDNTKVLSKDGIKTLGSTIYIKDKDTTKTHNVSSNSYVFKGLGAGHGVGMSQYGARGMAEAGFDYIRILKHYYTGVEVK